MSEAELLEAAADQALATSNGDACKAIKALIAAKHFLEPNWKSCAPPFRRAMREGSCCRMIRTIGMTKAQIQNTPMLNLIGKLNQRVALPHNSADLSSSFRSLKKWM
jgi:hypothetical protein